MTEPLTTLPARPLIADTALDLVGNTPLVRLHRVVPEGAEVLAKMEMLNPAGSVKDRIALAMIEDAERQGKLKPGYTIVEPTSGNTGIGLAMVAAIKGYKLILTMPEDMSAERRKLLSRYGVQFVLTPAIEGMSGAVYAAQEILEKTPDCFMPQQFENPANPAVHARTTAQEILEATDGRLDAFVAGVGTGGTITGVGRVLKERLPGVRIIAVEPSRSPVLQGGRAGLHAIQGIGASFVPGVFDRAVVDEIIAVTDDDAIKMMSRLAREEGLLAGVSSGANVWAAAKVAVQMGGAPRIVTVLPDTGERYLSIQT